MGVRGQKALPRPLRRLPSHREFQCPGAPRGQRSPKNGDSFVSERQRGHHCQCVRAVVGFQVRHGLFDLVARDFFFEAGWDQHDLVSGAG